MSSTGARLYAASLRDLSQTLGQASAELESTGFSSMVTARAANVALTLTHTIPYLARYEVPTDPNRRAEISLDKIRSILVLDLPEAEILGSIYQEIERQRELRK